MKLFLSAIGLLLLLGFNNMKEKKVKIGDQVWMAANLDVAKFRNGDVIPEARTDEEWLLAIGEKKPAWCYYDNDPNFAEKCGKLYNWYAVIDKRGLAPKGWHVPTQAEWEKLVDYLGGSDAAGAKMKSTTGWFNDKNGTNSSGFNAYPSGNRIGSGFNSSDGLVQWWNSDNDTEYLTFEHNIACYHALSFLSDAIFKGKGNVQPNNGYSVRCIKN